MQSSSDTSLKALALFSPLLRLFRLPPVLPGVSAMQTVAESLQQRVANLPDRPPTFLAREKALLRWESTQRDPKIRMGAKDLRILCGIESVVDSRSFSDYLTVAVLLSSPRAMRSLLATLHRLWLRREPLLAVEITLQQALERYKGHDRVLGIWKQHLDHVLGKQAPAMLATRYLASVTEVAFAEVLNALGLNGDSPFVRNVAEVALAQAIPHREEALQTLALSLDRVLPDLFVRVGQASRMAALDPLIGKVSAHRLTVEEQAQLKRFILNTPELGDPRLHPQHWSGFPPERTADLLRWLSSADIRFFFDLLLRMEGSEADTLQQKEQRKQFWLDYINRSPQFLGAWVVISRADMDRHRHALQHVTLSRDPETRDNLPPSFSRMVGRGNTRPISAFVLEFERYVVVEFSAAGHATFFYEKQAYLDKLGSGSLYSKDPYPMDMLKDPVYAIERLVHQGDWQSRFRTTLTQFGILLTS